MGPELGKVLIKDIRFDDKTHVKDGMFCVNKEEVGRLVLEDDKLIGYYVSIAKPGKSARITSARDVIEPRVKVSSGEIFPGVVGEVSLQVETGRTRTPEGCCVVTVGKIVRFQEGIIDMGGPAANYRPFLQTYNLCVVVEPAGGLETHVYEKAARMTGLKVAVHVGEAARELEPDEVITYKTKPIFERAVMYPDLPKMGYIHVLQSQGLLHDTCYYDAGAKQFIPTFMYPTEIMDGVTISGSCVVPCGRVTTYHYFHDPVIEDCYKHHGKDVGLMGAILTNEDVLLADRERHSDMVAKLYDQIGLGGMLITEEEYGNPDADLMMNCHKVKRAGTGVVLITDEFPGKDGRLQSLVDVCEETDALASCGQGSATFQFPAMGEVIGTQDFIEMRIGGWNGYKNPDGSFEAEFQIIIASVIASGFNKLAARGYQSKVKEMER